MASSSSKILSSRKIKRVAKPIIKKLRQSDILVELCGALRRGELEAEHAFIVVSSIPWTRYVVDHNFDMSNVIWPGPGIIGLRFTVDGIDFKCLEASDAYWGTAMLFATGTLGFVKTMVAHARHFGYALRHNGLWLGEDRVAGRNEKQVFESLGFPFIEPERRYPQKPYSKMFKGAPVFVNVKWKEEEKDGTQT